jgi:tyrosyl-tRNA synthetase
MISVEEQLAVLKRGVVDLIREEELVERLKAGRPLKVKFGADPSAPDLHLGHLVVLRKLREFQRFGHEVTFLIGDFTARIGDPTGRSETRKPLSEEEVRRNAETYENQVFRVLDRARTTLRFNSEWMGIMSAAELIQLCSHYTVARMLERDDFAKRFERGHPIALHEFLYPMIQGYDSVVLECDVELGGTDQKFNLLVGRDLQRVFHQPPQVVLTVPLLEGTDGVQKMSKSLNNAIGLMDPPVEMFGKIMSVSDATMLRYYELLTDWDAEQLRGQIASGLLHPMAAKKQLAWQIVADLWGKEDADNAQQTFERQFQLREMPQDMPEWFYPASAAQGWSLAQVLAESGLVRSTSEAKRLLRQGAVRVNGTRVGEETRLAPDSGDLVVQIGPRRWLRIRGAKKIEAP